MASIRTLGYALGQRHVNEHICLPVTLEERRSERDIAGERDPVAEPEVGRPVHHIVSEWTRADPGQAIAAGTPPLQFAKRVNQQQRVLLEIDTAHRQQLDRPVGIGVVGRRDHISSTDERHDHVETPARGPRYLSNVRCSDDGGSEPPS